MSAAFLDRVTALADASSGDAEALLAALARGEVKRFRDDAREALATWLREHGYLDLRAASKPAERVLAVERALHDASRGEARDRPPGRVGTRAVTLAGWLESGLAARVSAPRVADDADDPR